jgi:F-type H+-transporting ATPase subunit gamma
MPSTRDIRRRIKSVKGTAQITKAMQMVASSKMQKAQQSAINGRPFAKLGHTIMKHAAAGAGDFTHPLLEPREIRQRGVILVSTDKGLCGPLNTNLFREAAKYDPATTTFVAVGKKAAQFLARAKRKLVAEFTYHDTPTYGECQAIAHAARKMFEEAEVDEVQVLFTRFINTISQKPEARVLLPMGSLHLTVQAMASAAAAPADKPAGEEHGGALEYIFEPSPAEVMEIMLVYLLDFQVAQVLLEAKASEHSARMVAMKNATDNAKQLVKDLTLEYNKMRQASITKELLEITSATAALG